jgi:hypothetical protein
MTRRDEVADEDDLIGAAAYQLIMWGYSRRREAFAALAKAARKCPQGDGDGPLREEVAHG